MNNMMMQAVMNMLPNLKQNPMQFLAQRRLNLPQGVNMNDPQAILQHLVQTGQIPQQAVNNAYQMAQMFK